MEQAKKLEELKNVLQQDQVHIDYNEERYQGKWQDQSLPIWTRQIELENTMKICGVKRYKKIIDDARAASNESMTKYGQMLLKGLIEPMTAEIEKYVKSQEPAPRKKPQEAAQVFARLDYEVLALVTGKNFLDSVSMEVTLTKAAIRVGEAIEMEVRLEAFEQQQRRYFKRLHKALMEKRNYRHKRAVYNAKIHQFKIDTERLWDKHKKLRIGQKALELLSVSTGLLKFALKTVAKNKTIYYVQPTEKTQEYIEQYIGDHQMLLPEYLPMLVPPRDWKWINDEKKHKGKFVGGYCTHLANNPLVKVDSQLSYAYLEDLGLRADEMPEVYEAINTVQKTAWKVNRKVLEVVVSNYEKNNQLGDLPPRNVDHQAPQKPFDIATNEAARDRYKVAHRKFCDWKVEQLSKILQVKTIIRIAKVFEKEKRIYFPYQLDFRSRMYCMPMFLHPQYADYSRSILHFAEGKALTTYDDACWLAIHGCNSFGEDKISLDDRVKWVQDNEDWIFKCAENPHENTEWSKADKPYQFLAFCFEWKEFSIGNGEFNFGYKSHLPVQIDGSCNGLQHFSAMLKDEVGGAAVNLLPLDTPADIYGQVAERVKERLHELVNDTSKFGADRNYRGEQIIAPKVSTLAQAWLQFGVDRKIVKRPVMTLPYGSRRYSHRRYIEAEIIKRRDKGAPLPEDWTNLNDKNPLQTPSYFLANITLPAIHEIVRSARDVMAWLQTTTRIVSNLTKEVWNEKEQRMEIEPLNLPLMWTTPVGFKVQQAYPDTRSKRVKSKMGENIIKLHIKENNYKFDHQGNSTLVINPHEQILGVSPNYVHSMDGAALMKCVALAKNHQLYNFQVIHDAFATYACDTPKLIQCIKQSFIEIYKVDRLAELREEIINSIHKAEDRAKIPPLPEKGNLKIEEIWDSDFFFA